MKFLALALSVMAQGSPTMPAASQTLSAQRSRSASDAQLPNRQLSTGEARFRAAIALNPSVAAFHESLALVLEREGRAKEALAEHRAAIQLDSLSGRNHAGYGLLLYRLGHGSDALPELKTALALGDSSVIAPLESLTSPRRGASAASAAGQSPSASQSQASAAAGRLDVGQFGDDVTPAMTFQRVVQTLFSIILGLGALALIGPIIGIALLLAAQPIAMLAKRRAAARVS